MNLSDQAVFPRWGRVVCAWYLWNSSQVFCGIVQRAQKTNFLILTPLLTGSCALFYQLGVTVKDATEAAEFVF